MITIYLDLKISLETFLEIPSHSDSTPRPTLPQSEVPSPGLSEVKDKLEKENEFELLNHFDSLKADFEAKEDERWVSVCELELVKSD